MGHQLHTKWSWLWGKGSLLTSEVLYFTGQHLSLHQRQLERNVNNVPTLPNNNVKCPNPFECGFIYFYPGFPQTRPWVLNWRQHQGIDMSLHKSARTFRWFHETMGMFISQKRSWGWHEPKSSPSSLKPTQFTATTDKNKCSLVYGMAQKWKYVLHHARMLAYQCAEDFHRCVP